MSRNRSPLFSLLDFLFTVAVLWFGGKWLVSILNINWGQAIPNNPPSVTSTPIITPGIQENKTTFVLPSNVPNGTKVTIDGSTSMVQINQGLKHAFERAYLGANVNTNAQGSEIGLQNLLTEKIDIAAISRPLNTAEIQQGLGTVAVTQDQIAIVVGINNRFRRGLTIEQVQGIFSGKITNWSQAGGENLPIKVINRPPTSGTRKAFQELVLNGDEFGRGANFITLEKDATTPILNALGKEGITYATYPQVSAQSLARIVAVDGITPQSASYPYQRTLFYAYKQPTNSSVQSFLGYVTSDKGKQIIEKAQLSGEKVQPLITKSPLGIQKPINSSLWDKKEIRGIYLSRYQITNNASEQTIRARVRYYRSQGINTIIHGVWGNGCTMYKSQVMQKYLGIESCPNQFQEQWLDWLIDEAHQQGMQVHAYFEKGIKIDANSPIFDRAIAEKWIVPGVDRTYGGVEHYVLDVEIPEVATLFKDILVEFVKKYPRVDAVQWDDYLGYYAELPGKVDRTDNLTKFVKQMTSSMKKANPAVSFDLCHHNPYWAKRYFAADWQKWGVDRVFIQAYNEKNFQQELVYAEKYNGIAITDQQLKRLQELVKNPEIKSILIFPLGGKPETTAASLKNFR
jgi:ABC-type phosphate transport system substrate-binding protein